jgi:hypothetical protein
VWRDPAEPTNTQLIGSTGVDPREGMDRMRLQVDAPLRDLLAATAARTLPALRGDTVYTDDKAPVEWLVDLSLASEAQ